MAVFLTAALALPLIQAAPAAAIVTRAGVVTTTVATGFTYPTGVEVLPDGRLLVADKQGQVWLVVNGVTRTTPVIDLRARVNDYWDRGMVGLAIDPGFASNGYFYLYYALENGTGDSGTKTSRLSRFTLTGETANPASEFIVLGSQTADKCSDLPVGADCIPADFYGHQGGGMAFANDGTIFLSVGESASWDIVDDRALRAQDQTTLAGKVLHVTALGKGLPSNPYWTGNPDEARSKIYASGFRNPFRLTLHPTTGLPYVGEVGWTGTEEVNKVVAGGNYGWPCYEGTSQQGGYAPKPTCQTLYGQGAAAVKAPLFAYPHGTGSSSVTGGVFLAGTSFPALYQNAYLFGDYARNWIHYLELDAAGDPGPGGMQGFATAADGPVDFSIGPDGAVYYVAITSGEVRRMVYAPGGPTYVSDLTFTAASNGSGPYERDYSNGGSQGGDGATLTVGGVQYAKGLGVAAPSQIDFAVPSGCTSFTAVVGVDDEVSANGSVRFTVGNGATPLWQSTVMTGASPSQTVNVPLSGVSSLRLTVDNGGDGNANDHADWADAKLGCGTDSTAPTVTSMTPADGATAVSSAVAPVARFSEPLDQATVSASTVRLTTQPGGAAIAGAVTYDPTARSITFTPSNSLGLSSSYQFQVIGGASGIADLAGNRLAGNVSATFTTSATGATTRYVSDMTWGAVTNGWGPPERDRSNGEQGSADGNPLRVAGVTYTKGVGVHANSTIPLDLTGLSCTRFQAVIGVDDEITQEGTVRFQVWNGTATMLTQSAVITWSSAAATIDLDITNITNLRLVVTDNGNGNGRDHADWADAKLTCGQAGGAPPTVIIDTPLEGSIFAVNDTVSFTGRATAENGSAIPASQLQWEVQIRHCPQGDCHLHPVTQVTGSGGSIPFPDHGDDSFIDVKLTATDGAGRSASLTRPVAPRLVGLTLATSPAGLPLVYTGESVATPTTKQVVVGGRRTITASPQSGYTFQSWSDGGAAQHDVTMGSSAQTLTATYVPTTGVTTRYVSDMTWGAVTNGWGPPERDRSNGEQGSADGNPLRVAGVTYTKGVGVHANSTIPLDLTGLSCTRFQAVIGVDDEITQEGTVRFQVWNGTATMLTQSAVITWSSAAATIDLDITNITNLRLVVTDNGNGNGRDHADWADAKLTCGQGGNDTTAPTVTSMTPADGATAVSSAMAPVARFSEPLDQATVSASTVRLTTQPGGAAIAGAIAYDAAAQSVTFTPTTALAASSSYQFQVIGGASGIADLAGNRLAGNVSATFTTSATGATTRYVSDMTWGAVTNGWGPPERDRSNGEQGSADGNPLRVAGVTYTKGVGVHANSTIPLDLTGLSCTRFQAVIGVDDEITQEGTVRFQVWNGTATMLTQSAVITWSSAAATIDLDITNITNLRLVVTDNGNGNGRDHADWADAKLTCGQGGGGAGNPDGAAPTVTATTPSNGTSGVPSTTTATATFSEGMDPASLSASTVTVTRQGTTAAESAAVSYDAASQTVSIAPSTPLVGATTYVMRIQGGTGGARDLSGNTLVSHYVWRITTAAGGGATAQFAAPLAIPSGLNPHGVAIGDVDGDGDADLAAVNALDNTLAVFPGTGGGQFGPSTTVPTGAKPKTVLLADLDGDGRLDAVTANQDASTVSVLRGGGPGFLPRTDIGVCSGAHEVAAGELNGDGEIDLAVACTGVATISVLIGNGDGTFQPPFGVGVGPNPHSLVIADFNGDTRGDIAVANRANSSVSVLLANTSGGYVSSSLSTGPAPHAIRSGDINEDGVVDLVTANDGGTTLSLFIGNGNGTFQPASNLSTGNNPKGVAVADINMDGNLDLLSTNAANNYETGALNPGGDTFSLLLGNGAGAFGSPSTYTTGPTPFGIAVGDIDNDGRPDVATANWDGGTVTVWRNVGTAPPPPPSGQTRYVSDMTWGAVTNGWGPPERDRSNGEQGSADGNPLRVAGVTYTKGVGVHANSTIPLDLTGLNCTRFQAVIGVDDEITQEGTVRFQVWNGTATMLTQSAVITWSSAAATIDLDITDITNLRLVVTDNGNGNGRDHADWADAKLTCAA